MHPELILSIDTTPIVSYNDFYSIAILQIKIRNIKGGIIKKWKKIQICKKGMDGKMMC